MDKLRINLLLALILLLIFSAFIYGQSEDTGKLIIPEQLMKPAVQHILVSNFKPKTEKQVVYLFEKGLKKSWLPKIEGIEFQLLTADEIKKQKVYFFANIEKLSKNKFQIGFAFGEPGCSYSGTYWYLDYSKRKIRFSQNGYGFGGGCGNGEGHGN